MRDEKDLHAALARCKERIGEHIITTLEDECAKGAHEMEDKPLASTVLGSTASMVCRMALHAIAIEAEGVDQKAMDRLMTGWVTTLLGTIARDLEVDYGITTKVVTRSGERGKSDGGVTDRS